MRTRALIAAGCFFGLLGIVGLATPSFAGGDWNDVGIAWQPYDKGLAEAKEKKKPICLVFYTDWCPHCTNYSKVFHDPKVVEQSKSFVMIRLNKDENKELSSQYAPDGQYIPRTYFLSSGGTLDPSLHAPRDKYQYFYDESAPASILAGMESALKKLN
jgi:thioredoxin-like negative regulator of GroEL